MSLERVEEGQHPAEFLLSEANGYRSREMGTLADGQVNLAPGTVLGVVTASGEYSQLNPDSYDGDEVAAAILYGHGDADGDPQRVTVVVRDAEVDAAALVWPEGIEAGEIETAESELLDVGIISRS